MSGPQRERTVTRQASTCFIALILLMGCTPDTQLETIQAQIKVDERQITDLKREIGLLRAAQDRLQARFEEEGRNAHKAPSQLPTVKPAALGASQASAASAPRVAKRGGRSAIANQGNAKEKASRREEWFVYEVDVVVGIPPTCSTLSGCCESQRLLAVPSGKVKIKPLGPTC